MNTALQMKRNIVALAATCLLLACGGTPDKNAIKVNANAWQVDSNEPVITVSFTEKMVAKDAVGKEVHPPVTITPKVDGVFKWKDEDTLEFRPTEALVPSSRYTLRIDDNIKSLSPHRLTDNFEFNFETARLMITGFVDGHINRVPEKAVVHLKFTQPVAFDQVRKHCAYVSEKAKSKVRRDTEDVPEDEAELPATINYRIVPETLLTQNTAWKFTCNKDIKPHKGTLGLSKDFITAFKTFGPLKFIETNATGDDIVPAEDLDIELAFTNPLARPYKISISPKVPGFPKRCHALGNDTPGLNCSAMLEAQTNYTITIGKKQKDIFGQTIEKVQKLNFRTSDAQPTISMDDGYFVAELKRPVLPAWTRNVKKLEVRAVQITPENFHEIRPHLYWWDNDPADLSKSKLRPKTKVIDLRYQENAWRQQAIDPALIFGKESGPGMYFVEVGSAEVEHYPYGDGGRNKVLVNFTDIGVVSKLSPAQGVVWTTRLSTGEPLPNAKVHVRTNGGKVTWRGTTNAEGIAYLPSKQTLFGAKPNESDAGNWGSALDIYVHDGSDWTMVNALRNGGLSASNFEVPYNWTTSDVQLRGYLHTDRGLYRPGEEVHIKGLARETRLGESLRVPKKKKATMQIKDARGNTIQEEDVTISRFGGFWLDVDLPKDARLGDYTVTAKLEHGQFSSRFSVEEYQPATFEVTGKIKRKRVVRHGEFTAKVAAGYFYGAPVRKGDVEFTVYSRPRHISFKEFEGYNFYNEHQYSYYHSGNESQRIVRSETASLDENGNAATTVQITPDDIYSDADLLIRASVTSPTNEVIQKTFTVPYFRARRYFGIKTSNYFWDLNKKQTINVVGVTPSGKLADDKATLTIKRSDWNCAWEDWGYRGSYRCHEETETMLEQTLSFDGKPAQIDFTPKKGGDYWVEVKGDKGYHSKAAISRYVWGGSSYYRSEDDVTFDIITDKKEYQAGDTARLILKTDLAQATGLVTIERDGVIETRLVKIDGNKKQVEVPIDGKWAPNVYVSVSLVQGRMGKGKRGKPRMGMGLVNIPVRPENNRLTVKVTTNKKDYRPKEMVTATVEVSDSEGNPISAEVALTAADEGVLSLANFKTPNPIPTFYAPWGISVETATQYMYIKDIPGPNAERPATGGDSAAPGSVRSRFVSTAIWKPGIITDVSGKATVTFEAPDNLTAFRVMAVAADTAYAFGSADQRFTVSKPVQAKRMLPRFLNLGDKLQGGVIIHNDTAKDGDATVSVETDGRVAIAGEKTRTVAVGKGGVMPVLYQMTATKEGPSALQFTVLLNGESDAVKYTLPVQHPSPLRTKRVKNGMTQSQLAIDVPMPTTAIPQSAEVTISVDPNGLAGIEDGLEQLIGYPYGCLEQTTSKVVPMIAVKNLVESLKLKQFSTGSLDNFVEAGVAKIGRHQTYDGGFSLWPGGQSETYYTAYALWGLHLAQEAGYRVDQSRINDGINYLKYTGTRAKTDKPYYSHAGHLGSQTFSLYVQALLGKGDPQSAIRLLDQKDAMPIFGKAFVAMALAESLGKNDAKVQSLITELREIAASAVKSNASIVEPLQSELSYYMSGDIRTTAIVLNALVTANANDDLVPQLVQLIMNKRRGRPYLSTQDNIHSLLALLKYSNSIDKAAPSVKVLADDNMIIEKTLTGANKIQIAAVTLAKEGSRLEILPDGKVYYSVKVRYRDKIESIKAESNGQNLSRVYLDADGNGKTSYKLGDLVTVRLNLPLNDSVNHLMVADHIPAGFEVLNTRLATVSAEGVTESQSWRTYREIHDDGVDFATNYSWRNNLVYEFTIRAIAQGTFILPPAVSELMYQPDVNARTDIETIVINGK